jgi:hypothetical protein
MRRGLSSRVGTALRPLIRLSTAGLVLFHAWLAWRRLTAPDGLEAEIALRWTAGVGLLAALLVLRRFGVPLLWGRKAFALWSLVLLLHAVGPAAEARAEAASTPEPGLLLALPSGLPAAAALLGLLFALATAQPGRGALPPYLSGLVAATPALLPAARGLERDSPRPPPLF